MTPDVVFPVRPGHHDQPASLRYALRTLWHHVPHGRVFVVGHAPSFIDLDAVTYLPTVQDGHRYENQRRNLEAVLMADVAGEILWWDDDHFVLRDVDRVPLYDRGPIADYIEGLSAGGEYRDAQARALDLLHSWGHAVPMMPTHTPLPVDTGRLADVLTRAWADGWPDGVFKALYMAGLASETITDPKVKEKALPELDWPFVSTAPWSFDVGPCGDLIRSRYWRPSPYEVTT